MTICGVMIKNWFSVAMMSADPMLCD